jgi:zinc protease
VITKEVHSSNVVTVSVFVRGGTSAEPANLPGLANFTHHMLLRGTTSRTAEQIVAPIEAIGGTLQVRADYDYSHAFLLCSADALDTGLGVMADVIRRPRFDPAEVGKEREQILGVLSRLQEEPGWVLQREMANLLYASGPYGRAVPGTPESVKRITREQLAAFHRQHYTPENLIVVVVGNIDRAAAEEKVERAFGDMPLSGRAPAAFAPSALRPLKDHGANVAVRSRATDLAHLLIGFPMGAVTREEYPAVLVMNSLLSGGMGSRLMREVRERQGLSYDPGTFYAEYLGPSYLAAYIRTEPVRLVFGLDGPYHTPEMMLNKVKDALLEQFDWIRQHPVPESELERARRYTIGTFIYEHQRTVNQARYLGWFELSGLGYHYDEELPKAVEKVTKDDLLALARKYFTRYAVALIVPEAEHERR